MAKILVVDDKVSNRQLLVKLLGYGGHYLLEASDGAEALKQVTAERPDLVISDIFMPTMDGFEFVRRLRANPDLAPTPVVFYTATYHVSQVRGLAGACGVRHVLEKPSKPAEILRVVHEALGLGPPTASPPPLEAFHQEHLGLVSGKFSQKLQGVVDRLTAIIEYNLEVSSQRDPQRLLENFCRAAREIVGARCAVAGGFNGHPEMAGAVFASGLDTETAACFLSALPQQDILATLLNQRRSCRLRLLHGDSQVLGFQPQNPPFSSLLGAPIVSPARAYGWLCLLDKIGEDEFSEEDERLAGILAAQVGRIYENETLYTEVQNQVAQLEREVADRKRAEHALREQEEQVRLLLDSTAEAIYGLDLHGNCTFANSACARLLGYADPGELLGKNMHALMHHTRADKTPCPVEECRIYQALRRGEGAHAHDEVLWRADGNCFPAEYWSYPVRRDGELVGSVVTFLDISQRKHLEEQFRQAQKMEAVGRLAGGVAHDFNNLLTIIIGYSEMVLAGVRQGDPLRQLLEEIKRSGERAASLTRQLLAFSRKQLLLPVELDLNALIGDMEKMLGRLIGEDIQLIMRPSAQRAIVKADPGQIEQVLMNLVVNARDAMPGGGKLIIETGNVRLDETHRQQRPEVRPGRYVMLAVSDTGCGMDKQTQARIFEPFFTTKEPGKGTGLGLATVYGIVKQSEGYIYVYSEPGQGTTFKIYLPQVEIPTQVRQARPSGHDICQGTETLLLVEDEDGVRTLGRMILQRHGYTVLDARNGGEALIMCEQRKELIELLITDVVMPQMSGRQLAERLTAMRPELKVLYLSGYTDDAIVHHGVLAAGTPFLQKPFNAQALARKVREVLDAPRQQ